MDSLDSKGIVFRGGQLFIEDEVIDEKVRHILKKTQSYFKKTKKELEQLLDNKANVCAYLQILERSQTDKVNKSGS